MESLDSILNLPEAPKEPAKEPEEDQGNAADNTGSSTDKADESGVKDQVAADDAAQSYNPDTVKSELSALAKERERIRRKEAELDAAREQLNSRAEDSTDSKSASDTKTADTAGKDFRAEIRELRKQHREALAKLVIEGDDEETATLVDQLEDKMDELRLADINQQQRVQSANERAVNEFQEVYANLHDQYPFLKPDHPHVNAELNDDINTYYAGRLQRGDSQSAALRKAVEKYAPSYADSLTDSGNTREVPQNGRAATSAADKLLREKLNRGAFSDVRNVGRSADKSYSGPTPMDAILGKKAA